jgi:hypothetical protein
MMMLPEDGGTRLMVRFVRMALSPEEQADAATSCVVARTLPTIGSTFEKFQLPGSCQAGSDDHFLDQIAGSPSQGRIRN